MKFVIFVLIVIGFCLLNFYSKKKARRDKIYKKYGHTDIAKKIVNRTIWVGETSEQLIDSMGKPVDIDERVLKTKRKEVWKYYQKSTNRFGLKITIENDVLVGWDEKL